MGNMNTALFDVQKITIKAPVYMPVNDTIEVKDFSKFCCTVLFTDIHGMVYRYSLYSDNMPVIEGDEGVTMIPFKPPKENRFKKAIKALKGQ